MSGKEEIEIERDHVDCGDDCLFCAMVKAIGAVAIPGTSSKVNLRPDQDCYLLWIDQLANFTGDLLASATDEARSEIFQEYIRLLVNRFHRAIKLNAALSSRFSSETGRG